MVIRLFGLERVVMGIVFVDWALAVRAVCESKMRRYRPERFQRRGGGGGGVCSA